MKAKKISGYWIAFLSLMLLLGFLTWDRYEHRDLIRAVTRPELTALYDETVQALDPLALTQAGVIQSYEVDRLTVRQDADKVRLALNINHAQDQRLVLELEKGQDGEWQLASREVSRVVKEALEASTYQAAQKKLSIQASQILKRDGWDQAVLPAYYDQIRRVMKDRSLSDLDQGMALIDQESQAVGSSTYTAFFLKTALSDKEKLSLVLDHMQARIDKYDFLQLGQKGYTFAETLEPDNFFFTAFRQAVYEAYQTEEGLNEDELGLKLHLFRSWIDKQAITYIRTHYKGETDLAKLLAYAKDKGLALDYTTNASYHNRSLGDFTYPTNMKVQLPQTNQSGLYGSHDGRFIEFIVNMDTGQFVSEWNVYRQKEDGSYDSNPKHYSLEEGADVANSESANYGLPKGLNTDVPAYLTHSHQYLDVTHPQDNAIMRKMVKKWKRPKAWQNGGVYADIVKKGGLKDLESWQKIKEEDRLDLYRAYVASGLGRDGFSTFYSDGR